MIISAVDQIRYPAFTRYVRNTLPEVAEIGSIARAFRRYAQMNRTSLRRALRFGNQPTLRIMPLSGAPGTFRNGEFSPGIGSNEIRLNELLVQAFESGSPPHLAYTRNSAGQRFPRVGATILHELVHWGDDQDGIDFNTAEGDEEGELFEAASYGHNTTG